jgi:hypothetical protein
VGETEGARRATGGFPHRGGGRRAPATPSECTQFTAAGRCRSRDHRVVQVDAPTRVQELTHFDPCRCVAPLARPGRHGDHHAGQPHRVVVEHRRLVGEAAPPLEIGPAAHRSPGQRGLCCVASRLRERMGAIPFPESQPKDCGVNRSRAGGSDGQEGVRLEDKRDQEPIGRPQPGTAVKIAVDRSRSKWVYGVRWEGAERLRLSTGGELKHLQALVRRSEGCEVHIAFEACGFGYEVAWWAQEEQIAVTVIAPSRRERAPGVPLKTDRLDAGRMARQLEEGSLKG